MLSKMAGHKIVHKPWFRSVRANHAVPVEGRNFNSFRGPRPIYYQASRSGEGYRISCHYGDTDTPALPDSTNTLDVPPRRNSDLRPDRNSANVRNPAQPEVVSSSSSRLASERSASKIHPLRVLLLEANEESLSDSDECLISSANEVEVVDISSTEMSDHDSVIIIDDEDEEPSSSQPSTDPSSTTSSKAKKSGHVQHQQPRKRSASVRNAVLVCKICSKSFRQSGHLTAHMRIHTGERPFACDFCGKRFHQSGHLLSHIRSHADVRPYKCHYCSKSFTQSGHLRNHERLHSGERPYLCIVCHKGFAQSGHLINHIRGHDQARLYECPICEKKFIQSGHLNSHVLRHKYVQLFECLLCKKTFEKSHLKAHLHYHETTEPGRCFVCSANFPTKDGLFQHMEIHRSSGIDAKDKLSGAAPSTSAPPLNAPGEPRPEIPKVAVAQPTP